MADGDTILVVNRRPITAQVEHDALGTALKPQRILFMNGEDSETKSEIHQNPAVNAEWYEDAEQTIVGAKHVIGVLRDELGHLRYVHREDEIIKLELQQIVAHMRHELTVARDGQDSSQSPRLHPQQLRAIQEAVHQEQIRRIQGAAKVGHRPQLQAPVAPLPRAVHPAGQRRVRVNGAAAVRVSAEGQRKG